MRWQQPIPSTLYPPGTRRDSPGWRIVVVRSWHSIAADSTVATWHEYLAAHMSALRFGRCFIGVELKPEYAHAAVKNLRAAEIDAHAQQALPL